MMQGYKERFADYHFYCKKCEQLMMGVSLERKRQYAADEVIIEDVCQHCGHHNVLSYEDLTVLER